LPSQLRQHRHLVGLDRIGTESQELGLADLHAFKTSFGTVSRAAFRPAVGSSPTPTAGPQCRGLSVNDLGSYEATPEYVTE
jgi:hypothetical protein